MRLIAVLCGLLAAGLVSAVSPAAPLQRHAEMAMLEVERSEKFIGSIMSAVGNVAPAAMSAVGSVAPAAMGAVTGTMTAFADPHTTGQKEACVGCLFVWRKIHSGLDQSAGMADVKRAFDATCARMPDVFFDACDSMARQQEPMFKDYLAGKSFEDMCNFTGLCWTTFHM